MAAQRAARRTRGGGGEQALYAASGRGGPCFAVQACPALKPCVRQPDVDRRAHTGRGGNGPAGKAATRSGRAWNPSCLGVRVA
jgi:hypothetical protein